MALIDDIARAAAIAAPALFTGSTPTKARYESFISFAEQQFRSYANMGVANPALGPFEALGKAFATDATTKGTFATHFGGGSTEFFVRSAYDHVYAVNPSSAAVLSLVGQVDYFTALYQNVGIPPADAALQARGAVLGQIMGYAFTDASAASRTVLDNVVNGLVAAAARGDFSGFGKALPGFPLPTPPTFVVPQSRIDDVVFKTGVTEVFMANPAYYANSITNFIVGEDKIDLTAFGFKPGIALAATTVSGASGQLFISNGVHYAGYINSGMLFLDVDGNGDFRGTTDISIQLVGTVGNPSNADLIF